MTAPFPNTAGDGQQSGDAFQARATAASRWSLLRVSSIAGIAIALAACSEQSPLVDPPEKGILRTRLFQQCLVAAGQFTPTTIADRGSWSEVVEQCETAAMYQTNTCSPHFRACLTALAASGTSGSAQDAQRLDPKGAGPTRKAGDAR